MSRQRDSIIKRIWQKKDQELLYFISCSHSSILLAIFLSNISSCLFSPSDTSFRGHSYSFHHVRHPLSLDKSLQYQSYHILLSYQNSVHQSQLFLDKLSIPVNLYTSLSYLAFEVFLKLYYLPFFLCEVTSLSNKADFFELRTNFIC